MKKKNNKHGFTLAELLIVVAIIAVLTAVAIPVFTKQLEKSRDATSVANMRSAYAEAQVAILTREATGNASAPSTDNKVTVSNVAIKSQKGDSWSGLGSELPFTPPTDADGIAGTKTMVFSYDTSDQLTGVAFGS